MTESSLLIEAHNVDQPGQPARINVAGTIDFNTVVEGLETLSTAIKKLGESAGREPLEISLSGVTESNSAALALLIECRAEARRSSANLVFTDLPQSVVQLAEVCEATPLLAP